MQGILRFSGILPMGRAGACALLLALGMLPAARAQDCGSADPIIIPIHTWASQAVMSHVVGQLFEKIGCSVRYVSEDSHDVYEAVRLGDAALQVEVWQGLSGAAFAAARAKGGIVEAGEHAAVGREEWWYPAHVARLCPGLPDWKALEKCSEIFARPDSGGKGVFVDGPPEWLHDYRRIEALEMNFTTVNTGGAAALWEELETAVKNKTPIVMFNWSPNFTDALYRGKFVEFPAFNAKCRRDAKWGVNPKATHDCGNPPGARLKKAAWAGMPKKWPAAYRMLTRVSFTTRQIGVMSALVDVYTMDPPRAAARWLARNEKVWRPWMPKPPAPPAAPAPPVE